MTFEDFEKQISSVTNPVILLEGKRMVKKDDEETLTSFAKMLAEKFPAFLFRTGNAKGADELFTKGVSEIDASRLEIILPYSAHRKKNQIAISNYVAIDEINIAAEPEIIYQTKNSKNKNMIEAYLDGNKNSFSAKAPYLLRDTLKVIGSVNLGLKKATFAFFYDDLENPCSGGTGHTMKVCQENQVPFCTQVVWKDWIK